MTPPPFWVSVRGMDHPPWLWMVVVSVFLHGAVFLGIWGAQRYTLGRTMAPSVISVRLVGAPPGGQTVAPKAAAPSAAKTTNRTRVRRPPIPQTERKAVSINPAEVKPPELRRPERQETAPSPAKEAPAPRPQRPEGSQESGASAAAPPGGGGGGTLTPEEARYIDMLRSRIEENWQAYLPPGEGVLGEVRIQIARDGQIRDLNFLRGSGQANVDASIVRALKKVALPPPPATLAERPLILRFWPSGPTSDRSISQEERR